MKQEYQTFVSSPEVLKDGQEMKLALRDLSAGLAKYEVKIVRALVASDATKMPDGDVLWLRSLTGKKMGKPWAVKVLEELDDFIPCKPYTGGVEVNEKLNEAD